MTITIEDMRSKLTTLDDVRERLAKTEPLNSSGFTVGHDVWFKIDQNWNAVVEDLPDESLVDAYVTLPGGRELQFTKEALLEATSICGLPKGYVQRAPAQFIAPQLNYWFRGGLPDNDYKVLSTDTTALAVTRQAVKPYSNLRLLDEVLGGIEAKYGVGEVLVDRKFTHSLRSTHMRVIVPEQSRVIERTGTENDTWSLGLQVKNSLIGEDQTAVDGYLFRYWCTNGMIDTHESSGTWSRRGGQGQGDEVYAWARASVDEILGGLEHSFDAVQELVDIPVEGEAVSVLRDIFAQYKIPTDQQNSVIAEMVEQKNLNMYSVVNAITTVANNVDLKPSHVERLMRVGGDLTHTAHSRCDACRRLLPD